MIITDKFDGFSIQMIEDEDGDMMANFIELPNVSACGSTPEEALQELKEAWEAMKESYHSHGIEIPVAPSKKSYSGQFNVRIDKRDHMALALEASRVGLSLNALIAQKLHQAVLAEYSKKPPKHQQRG